MKRLLWYLNQDGEGAPLRNEVYNGECEVVYLKPGGEVINPERMGVRREPTYWQNGIAYTVERTNRAAVSRPTVIIAIPAATLGIEAFTPAAADFCLRAIKPYFDVFNAGYANKSRPDYDNGKFYVYEPGGEVLVRNASYFYNAPGEGFYRRQAQHHLRARICSTRARRAVFVRKD